MRIEKADFVLSFFVTLHYLNISGSMPFIQGIVFGLVNVIEMEFIITIFGLR